jgi:hypothetical protein
MHCTHTHCTHTLYSHTLYSCTVLTHIVLMHCTHTHCTHTLYSHTLYSCTVLTHIVLMHCTHTHCTHALYSHTLYSHTVLTAHCTLQTRFVAQAQPIANTDGGAAVGGLSCLACLVPPEAVAKHGAFAVNSRSGAVEHLLYCATEAELTKAGAMVTTKEGATKVPLVCGVIFADAMACERLLMLQVQYCTIHCTLYSLYTVLTICTVLTIHCTHYTPYSLCTVLTVFTVFTLHCTHFTPYSLYTVLTMHCTHCTPYSLYTVLTKLQAVPPFDAATYVGIDNGAGTVQHALYTLYSLHTVRMH